MKLRNMVRRFLFAGIGMVLLMLLPPALPAGSPLLLSWHGAVELAAGAGEKGPWRQNDSRYAYVDDPSVALHEDGAAAVVWADQASKDVFFQRIARDGAKHEAPVNVSRSPATFSWLPRMVIAPGNDRQIFILWQEIIFSGGSHGGDILFARSTDGGVSFSAPLNLSDSIGGDGKGRVNREVWSNGSLDLAAGADGSVYVTWTEYDGMLWLAHSNDGGNRFSAPRNIAGNSQRPARAPALAVGQNQQLYLAWTVFDDDGANIHIVRSDDAGASFSAPRQIGDGHADAPKLAIDAKGTLHLVYAQSVAGPFGRYQIRYARAADGATRFAAPRTISHASHAQASAAYPALAVDAQGRIGVIWEVFPDAGARPRGLAMTLSSDGGNTFAAPALVPDSRDPDGGANGSQQGLLMKKLAMNGNGAIAVVNSSLVPGQRSRVWLMRGELNKQ